MEANWESPRRSRPTVAVPAVLLLEGTVSPHPACGGWGGEDVRLPEAAGGSPSRDTAGIPAMLDPFHCQETRGREQDNPRAAREGQGRCEAGHVPLPLQETAGWLLPGSASHQMAGTWGGGSRGLCLRPPPTALEMSRRLLRKC